MKKQKEPLKLAPEEAAYCQIEDAKDDERLLQGLDRTLSNVGTSKTSCLLIPWPDETAMMCATLPTDSHEFSHILRSPLLGKIFNLALDTIELERGETPEVSGNSLLTKDEIKNYQSNKADAITGYRQRIDHAFAQNDYKTAKKLLTQMIETGLDDKQIRHNQAVYQSIWNTEDQGPTAPIQIIRKSMPYFQEGLKESARTNKKYRSLVSLRSSEAGLEIGCRPFVFHGIPFMTDETDLFSKAARPFWDRVRSDTLLDPDIAFVTVDPFLSNLVLPKFKALASRLSKENHAKIARNLKQLRGLGGHTPEESKILSQYQAIFGSLPWNHVETTDVAV